MNGKKTILVIDDDADVRMMLDRMLAEQGYRMLFADGATLACEIAQVQMPDLILLDMRLPGVDGIEVCRRLKTALSTRHIPVLFITSASSQEEKRAAFAVGTVDYLVKPLLKDECLSRITVHMRISALLEENVARAKECESMALALARDLADRRSEGNEGADVWLFVDAMRDGFVVVDVVSDKIVFSNPAFERQVGFSRKELRGLGVRDLDVSWGEAFWREHLEALRRDTRGLTLVRDLVTKNGSCVRAEISTCLIEQNGNARIVATVRALSGGATR